MHSSTELLIGWVLKTHRTSQVYQVVDITRLFCLQVVPASAQGNGPNINAYISLCLGVSLSFSAALSILLLWRWAHHRGQEGLPTLAPARTCTGIEPETVASFPSYRYKAKGGHSVTARAASTRQSKQAAAEEDAEVLIGSRRASEPVLPSPRLAANSAADPIK